MYPPAGFVFPSRYNHYPALSTCNTNSMGLMPLRWRRAIAGLSQVLTCFVLSKEASDSMWKVMDLFPPALKKGFIKEGFNALYQCPVMLASHDGFTY